MRTVGNILRELRTHKSLLLRQVGADLSIDPTILSKIERDERMPTKEQIDLLANYFNASKKELIIAYLSDKIYNEIQDEEFGLEAIKVAESKIEYRKTNT